MRFWILLAFSLIPDLAIGSDGVEVVTTTKTNASGSIVVKEVFIRNGQTNLVRTTQTSSGVLAIRIHQVYQNGNRLALLTGLPDSGSVTTEAGSPYSINLEYGASGVLRYVTVADTNGIVRDAFRCTNGVLSPVGSSELADATQIGAAAKELVNSRKDSPEQFHRKLDEVRKKYGEK